jgi:ribosomal protein S20
MSNTLYVKFLMRKLVECLNQGQKEKANELIQKIMKELD